MGTSTASIATVAKKVECEFKSIFLQTHPPPPFSHQFLINPSLADLSQRRFHFLLLSFIMCAGREKQPIFKMKTMHKQFQYFIEILMDNGHIEKIADPKQVFAFIPFKICIALGKYFCALQLSLVRCL